jgi:hypothetical protein
MATNDGQKEDFERRKKCKVVRETEYGRRKKRKKEKKESR